MTPSDEHGVAPAPEDSRGGGLLAAASPLAVAALVACVVAGAVAGAVFLTPEFSLLRRSLGGAIAGFGCWLLVMCGRIL